MLKVQEVAIDGLMMCSFIKNSDMVLSKPTDLVINYKVFSTVK
jgi:hypothetical protein